MVVVVGGLGLVTERELYIKYSIQYTENNTRTYIILEYTHTSKTVPSYHCIKYQYSLRPPTQPCAILLACGAQGPCHRERVDHDVDKDH